VLGVVHADHRRREDLVCRDVALQAGQLALLDLERGRLDLGNHPFCTSIGPGDIRIALRYFPRNFARGFFALLHETGHALGLPHTAKFPDIMYSFQYGGDITEYFGRYRRQLSSRRDIQKHSGMSPEDREKLLELYP